MTPRPGSLGTTIARMSGQPMSPSRAWTAGAPRSGGTRPFTKRVGTSVRTSTNSSPVSVDKSQQFGVAGAREQFLAGAITALAGNGAGNAGGIAGTAGFFQRSLESRTGPP